MKEKQKERGWKRRGRNKTRKRRKMRERIEMAMDSRKNNINTWHPYIMIRLRKNNLNQDWENHGDDNKNNADVDDDDDDEMKEDVFTYLFSAAKYLCMPCLLFQIR